MQRRAADDEDGGARARVGDAAEGDVQGPDREQPGGRQVRQGEQGDGRPDARAGEEGHFARRPRQGVRTHHELNGRGSRKQRRTPQSLRR